MELDSQQAKRLKMLLRVAEAEEKYLKRCDARLFSAPVSASVLKNLASNDDLAERIDAFVARFGRLQDTLGDKLLPMFLQVMGERTGTVLENLDRAEKLHLIESADLWMAARKLRNRMIHEYVCDMNELAQALALAHQHIPMLGVARDKLARRLLAVFPSLSNAEGH